MKNKIWVAIFSSRVEICVVIHIVLSILQTKYLQTLIKHNIGNSNTRRRCIQLNVYTHISYISNEYFQHLLTQSIIIFHLLWQILFPKV